ncbi:UV DNA damage repair endonuclease UvsE [Vallitalea guaymasensis]|uniref:UV DNA damage repair endonuclease UvsE n=1 Tax=Vallitalea guaymasensis TaxID=1185412 RepID=UPI000DE35162|nr:UV DNA damage repair endonuclease UvsE [Vallitalea guaymasensis]
MKCRLGYVSLALDLEKVTSSSVVTYRHYKSLTSEQKINKLKKVTLSNLQDLEKILNYNAENDIHFYRLTSNLVPLATHPDVVDWDYRKFFSIDFEYIGKLIKKYDMRVDLHADQFNVINSTNKDIVEKTITNLYYLAMILEDIGLYNGKIIIHVGSSMGGKKESINRFITNFKHFPKIVTDKIIIENDDKIFNIIDVLKLCNELKVPMVLDAHHYRCNNEGENLYEYIGDIFDTWNNDVWLPKIHYSSGRDSELDRKHSDYIFAKEFIDFVEQVRNVQNRDFDIMLESKKKEIALFKLMEDIKELKKDWNYIDKTTFEL